MFLLSLDEIDRVKRTHGIASTAELERVTGVTRKTWAKALRTREPTPSILCALASLGARPTRVLVLDEAAPAAAAA